jgi:hypothetical protein
MEPPIIPDACDLNLEQFEGIDLDADADLKENHGKKAPGEDCSDDDGSESPLMFPDFDMTLRAPRKF